MSPTELSEWLRGVSAEVKATKPQFPLNVIRGCPIPFFGNVINARVLTVGVNPSNTEFAEKRQWLEPLSLPHWQERLLNYFNWPSVPVHPWFETWSICLQYLGVTYAGGQAAHVDVSPRPTPPMLGKNTDKREFRAMVEYDVKWFFDLLTKLPQVQLLLVAGPIPMADGAKQQLVHFIAERAGACGAEWREDKPLPKLIMRDRSNGIPVFVCPYESNVDGLFAMVRQVYRNRQLLRSLAVPQIQPVPILPARLDWPSAIGNFLLNFGILDYFVFVFLKDHLSPEEFEVVKEWHFKDRLERISQYLVEPNASEEQQSAFARLVKRLYPIRELRNHLAHGHMYVRINPETQQPLVTILKAKDLDTGFLPNSKHVEFAELVSASSTLTKLIEEFQIFAGFGPVGGGTASQ